MHPRFRTVPALALAFAVLSSCRAPVQDRGPGKELSCVVVLAGPAAFVSGGRAADGRLLLPTAATVRVHLAPLEGSASSPEERIVPVDAAAGSVPVRFTSLAAGKYRIDVEARDAGGTPRFVQSAEVDLSGGGQRRLALSLVPAPASGDPFEVVSSPRTFEGPLGAGAAATWLVDPAAPLSGDHEFGLAAPDDVLFFVQDEAGRLLNSDPRVRTVPAAGRPRFLTLYNGGAADGGYALEFRKTVPVVPAPVLVARWSFEPGANGFSLVDSVGGAAAARIGEAAAGDLSAYRSGGGMRFDGASALDLKAASLAGTPPPWTVCAWVRANFVSDPAAFVAGPSYGLRLSQPGASRVGCYAGTSSFDFSSTVNSGGWRHVAFVNDGKALRLYVDGVPDPAAIEDADAVSMGMPLAFLGRDADGGKALNGDVDDFRAYVGALSPADVAKLVASYPRTLTFAYGAHGNVSADPDKEFYEAGETVALTAVPADSTWAFSAWTGDATGTGPTTTLVMDSDKTVGADFASTVPRYSLRYNVNGGTWDGTGFMGTLPASDETDIIGGETRTVHSSGAVLVQTFTPPRYFSGWNVRADAGGQRFLPGETVTMNADLTLYADWQPDDAPNAIGDPASPGFVVGAGSPPLRIPGYVQYHGDMDYYRIDVLQNANPGSAIEITIEGVFPALFRATICNDDGSGYVGTGWNLDGTYVPATKTVDPGKAYYVYVLHQDQAQHNGPLRTGAYNIVATFR